MQLLKLPYKPTVSDIMKDFVSKQYKGESVEKEVAGEVAAGVKVCCIPSAFFEPAANLSLFGESWFGVLLNV